MNDNGSAENGKGCPPWACTGCDTAGAERRCGLPVGAGFPGPIASRRVIEQDTPLYYEGQKGNGVYILCSGRVKLSAISSEGRVTVVNIAKPGEILGLSSAVSGGTHAATAVAIEHCEARFISSDDLQRYMHENPDAAISIARALSRSYRSAVRRICSLSLSETVADRLGRLFLDWCGGGNGHAIGNGYSGTAGRSGSVMLSNPFTHEQMAEMVGASRETVTRALRQMREKRLVTLKGSRLIIHDHERLRQSVK